MAKRMRAIFNDGRRKFGFEIKDNEVMYIEDCIQCIALDVVESYSEINEGKKKREETNIDLQMEVLGSLSDALKSLGVILYH